MSHTPRVSIIVPNYNHRAFLPERLESIYRQTFSDFELLLLDDASTDGSRELLSEWSEKHQLRFLVNESNSGSPFHQWNKGILEAQGEYVWIAESDDSAQPDFLDKLVTILDRHPSVGLAECDSNRIDDTGCILGPMVRDTRLDVAHRWDSDFLAEGKAEIRQFLYVQNTIPSASAVVFRRQKFLDAGLADDSFKLSGDWLQWIRILLTSDYYFHAEALSLTRVHERTQRVASAQDGRLELESLKLQYEIRKLIDVDLGTIRRGADRYAISWIQGVRSGRYRGPCSGHARCLWRLCRIDFLVALKFASRLPYALTAWFLKNTLFPSRRG